MPKKYPKNA